MQIVKCLIYCEYYLNDVRLGVCARLSISLPHLFSSADLSHFEAEKNSDQEKIMALQALNCKRWFFAWFLGNVYLCSCTKRCILCTRRHKLQLVISLLLLFPLLNQRQCSFSSLHYYASFGTSLFAWKWSYMHSINERNFLFFLFFRPASLI